MGIQQIDEEIWLKVGVEIPEAAEEPFLGALGEWTSRGVEVLTDGTRPVVPALESMPPCWIRLSLYGRPNEIEELQYVMYEALSLLKSLFIAPDTSRMLPVEAVEPGWRDRWKSFFHVTQVSPRLVIRPSWEQYTAKSGEYVIDLDPGTAFGTGGHATTRLCLVALDALIAKGAPEPRVLDFGTGSGVLAIAAAKLGASVVVALDNDDEAVGVATENVAQNNVARIVSVANTPLEQISQQFDIIVANILGAVLVKLRDVILSKLVGGGTVVLSGILQEEAQQVAAAYVAGGMQMVSRRDEGEWSALELRAPE
ncbi:MAG: 50S ribosomal protein L11 methyltransferase [Myxococcales bacterium]|nr:50S ribosomal protein L11 methyltransferase [Myxococcales bacterium]